MTAATSCPAIDPFRAVVGGRYEDDVVVVSRRSRPGHHGVHTPHFDVWTERGKLHLAHRIAPEAIDDDVAGLLTAELFGPGWVSGSDAFERMLTGVVLTSAADPDAAWALFYRNTLRRLQSGDVGSGSLSAYAPVYRHAISLVRSGAVLELGCCFGFLSLQLATRCRVTASDVTVNTVRLLERIAPRLGLRLDTLACDAARVPLPNRCVDTVLAIHLLEHLEPDDGAAVVAEALRLADRRVVIAVPFEERPNPAFGHVRTFGLDELTRIGQDVGAPFAAYEHHGGWLVIDR